jgi:hypothetical protein
VAINGKRPNSAAIESHLKQLARLGTNRQAKSTKFSMSRR